MFKYYNPSNYELSDDHKTTQIINNFQQSTIYGNICIPSCSKTIHEWKFKIIKGYHFGIGIDEARYTRKDFGSFNWCPEDTKMYALWTSGDSIRWDQKYRKSHQGFAWQSIDIVEMQLDLYSDNKTLSYVIHTVNGGKYTISLENITVDKNITYCMGVCGGFVDDKIKLLSYHRLVI